VIIVGSPGWIADRNVNPSASPAPSNTRKCQRAAAAAAAPSDTASVMSWSSRSTTSFSSPSFTDQRYAFLRRYLPSLSLRRDGIGWRCDRRTAFKLQNGRDAQELNQRFQGLTLSSKCEWPKWRCGLRETRKPRKGQSAKKTRRLEHALLVVIGNVYSVL